MAGWFYKGIFWIVAGGCFLAPQKTCGQGTLIVPFGGVKQMGPGHTTQPLPYEKNYIMLPMTSGKVMHSDGGQTIIVRKPVQLHPTRKTVIPLDQVQGQVSPTPVVPRGFNGGNVTHYTSATSCPMPTYPSSVVVSPSSAPTTASPEFVPTPTYATPETPPVSPPTEPLPAPVTVPSEAPSILVPSETMTETPSPYLPAEESPSFVPESASESTISPSPAASPEMPENTSEKVTEPEPYLPMNFSPPVSSPMVSEETSENVTAVEETETLTESAPLQTENVATEPEIPVISSEPPVLEAEKREVPPTPERPAANRRAGNSIYHTPAISTYRENGEILTRRANIMDYYQNVAPIQVPKQGGSVRMGASPSTPPTTPAESLPNALPGGKPASAPLSPGSSQAGRKV
ncbi:MAG: hypothetical protein Q4D62_15255 [Planctomycetia bacterium]|nr:hypothetical protein [Planctomycetia bacterium]